MQFFDQNFHQPRLLYLVELNITYKRFLIDDDDSHNTHLKKPALVIKTHIGHEYYESVINRTLDEPT